METQQKQKRAGMVAVIGRANVGKSSLLNAILGEKLSIVSPVAQTTRNAIRGIFSEERGQIVFVDTPGIHRSESSLGQVMNKMARASVEGCDAALLVLDVTRTAQEEDRGWIARLLREPIPVFVALNKTDALIGDSPANWPEVWNSIAAERKLSFEEDAAAHAAAEEPPTDGVVRKAPRKNRRAPEAIDFSKQPQWFKVSAMTGAGVPDLVGALFEKLPEGEPLFPEDMLSDYPRKLAIADFIREKLFGVLREELPHAVAVWVENVAEGEDGSWAVDAKIYVKKASQKGIVLGEKGRLLRKIKRQSEAELSSIYERPVTVDLWVKVEKDWNENFWLLKKFGYVE